MSSSSSSHHGGDDRCCLCFPGRCVTRARLVGAVFFGLWNNASTLYNARTLYVKDHKVFSFLTLFFLLFPGLVTSLGFLVLHCVGAHRRLVGRLPTVKAVLCFVGLLVFYPAVPIALSIYALVTDRRHQLAALAKMLEGFLDDGPQFVLRLIIVVLYDIGLGTDKLGMIFTMSMVTSFLSLVLFGLHFNERDTFASVKYLVCVPMFAAFAGARAFTLAVFLKETLGHTKEAVGGFAVLLLFCAINIGAFKLSGQDTIRSLVFGLCSLIIPAGYSNDSYYYQCPNQPLSSQQSSAMTVVAAQEEEERDEGGAAARYRVRAKGGEEEGGGGGAAVRKEVLTLEATLTESDLKPPNSPSTFPKPPSSSDGPASGEEGGGGDERGCWPISALLGDQLKKDSKKKSEAASLQFESMRSGVFLTLYTVSNAVLLSCCAAYVSSTRDLDDEEDSAIILPQILALIPGCFFALARSILLPDLKPSCCHRRVWAPFKTIVSVFLTLLAYFSLIPALFWSAVYKLFITLDISD